jgi:hypothetical protein
MELDGVEHDPEPFQQIDIYAGEYPREGYIILARSTF